MSDTCIKASTQKEWKKATTSVIAKGIAKVSQDAGLPVVFGVITADTIEQAIERAGTKDGNKGRDAAQAAVEMVNLLAKI